MTTFKVIIAIPLILTGMIFFWLSSLVIGGLPDDFTH
jgi:hypothetical protein